MLKLLDLITGHYCLGLKNLIELRKRHARILFAMHVHCG